MSEVLSSPTVPRRPWDLMPAYFLLRTAVMALTGLAMIGSVYHELNQSTSGDASWLALGALLYAGLFAASYLYMIMVYPVKESDAGAGTWRDPFLLVLIALLYGMSLVVIDYGISTQANLYIIGLLLMFPAVMAAGLRWLDAVVMLALASLVAGIWLAGRVEPHFLLQLLAGQVLVLILHKAMLNEYGQKTRANYYVAELAAAQRLLQTRVEQETREAIARDLHDELGHLSAVISNNLNRYLQTTADDPLLKDTHQLVLQLGQQVRAISSSLQPQPLDLRSALMALQEHIERPEIQLEITGFDGLCPPGVGEALFRACQEIITNSIRHSNATELRIAIHKDADAYQVKILDNGTGKQDLEPGNGLRGLESRLSKLNGQLSAALTLEGFRASIRIPLP